MRGACIPAPLRSFPRSRSPAKPVPPRDAGPTRRWVALPTVPRSTHTAGLPRPMGFASRLPSSADAPHHRLPPCRDSCPGWMRGQSPCGRVPHASAVPPAPPSAPSLHGLGSRSWSSGFPPASAPWRRTIPARSPGRTPSSSGRARTRGQTPVSRGLPGKASPPPSSMCKASAYNLPARFPVIKEESHLQRLARPVILMYG